MLKRNAKHTPSILVYSASGGTAKDFAIAIKLIEGTTERKQYVKSNK